MDKSDHALRQSGERQNSERQIGDNWIASDNLAVVGKAESAGNLLRREAYCHMKPTIKGSDEALKQAAAVSALETMLSNLSPEDEP